jgi:hypothetical protein
MFLTRSVYSFRLWDLSAIKEKKNAGDKIRAGRRLSLLTMMSSNKDGSESGRVSCVGKVRSACNYWLSLSYIYIYICVCVCVVVS